MDFENLNLTSCTNFYDITNTNDEDLKKKTILKIDFFGNYLENDLKLLENVKTAKDPWCVLAPISQLLLGQKSKVRTLLKSWERVLFKTDLTF